METFTPKETQSFVEFHCWYVNNLGFQTNLENVSSDVCRYCVIAYLISTLGNHGIYCLLHKSSGNPLATMLFHYSNHCNIASEGATCMTLKFADHDANEFFL